MSNEVINIIHEKLFSTLCKMRGVAYCRGCQEELSYPLLRSVEGFFDGCLVGCIRCNWFDSFLKLRIGSDLSINILSNEGEELKDEFQMFQKLQPSTDEVIETKVFYSSQGL